MTTSISGILKNRGSEPKSSSVRLESVTFDGSTNTRSILKQDSSDLSEQTVKRRSSLHNSYASAGKEDTMKGILKRKLSYDNQVIHGSSSFSSFEGREYSSEQCLSTFKSSDEEIKPILKLNKPQNSKENVTSENATAELSTSSSFSRSHPKPILKNHSSLSGSKSPSFEDSLIAETGTSPKIRPCLKKKEDETENAGHTSHVNNAIKEKIGVLKIKGETEWKKRVPSKDLEDLIHHSPSNATKCTENSSTQSTHESIDKIPVNDHSNKRDSSQSVSERLKKLDQSKQEWKKRVKDPSKEEVRSLTVEGKLKKEGKTPIPKVIGSNGAVNTPTFNFQMKSRDLESLSNCTDLGESLLRRSSSCRLSKPNSKIYNLNNSKIQSNRINFKSENTTKNRREFSYADEDFDSFFAIPNPVEDTAAVDQDSIQFMIDSSGDTSYLLKDSHKKSAATRVLRNHRTPRNPVKSLNRRLEEEASGDFKCNNKEIRDLPKENIIFTPPGKTQFTAEAMAGLASTEDFSAVKLKKTDSNPHNQHEFPSVILIQIKGKRFVQTRLVKPTFDSLNDGDCFVLVTPSKVYHYVGKYSNRMEKSRSKELTNYIMRNKDLGICSSASLIRLDGSYDETTIRKDWADLVRILDDSYHHRGDGDGGEESQLFYSVVSQSHLGDEDDEKYELQMMHSNCVYKVVDGSLKFMTNWSFQQPKYSYLKDDEVLIFDFIAELYVWCGNRASAEDKTLGYTFADKLFACPDLIFKETTERPSWSWIKKLNQHMETILFIEKFHDWPIGCDLQETKASKGLKGKMHFGDNPLMDVSRFKDYQQKTEKTCFEFEPCNFENMAADMRFQSQVEVNMELENFDIQRGGNGIIVDISDGLRREYKIETRNLCCWKISEFSKIEVELPGLFYSNQNYVIEWNYVVSSVGRDLSNSRYNNSRYNTGRERIAYFYWQGQETKITEQGASALMTVDLDKGKGPQIRIEQGREPPAFLALFEGKMVLNTSMGNFQEPNVLLYIIHGNVLSEGHCIQVAAEASSLRSKGVFILVNKKASAVYLWKGMRSCALHQEIGASLAHHFCENWFNWSKSSNARMIEVEEKEEPVEFYSSFHIASLNELRNSYYFIDSSASKSHKIRNIQCFRFSSLSGSFVAEPILSLQRKKGIVDPFPVVQETLYDPSIQPALFMFFVEEECLWIWRGWWPQSNDDFNENVHRGSDTYRWMAERKAALETAMSYTELPKFVVVAGSEPKEFKDLFPYWNSSKLSPLAVETDLNADGMKVAVETERQKFLRKVYTVEEVRAKPEGIDLSKLEEYISDGDFEKLFEMNRDQFKNLPQWKKTELKKTANLF